MFINATTIRTLPGSVAGVNRYNRDSGKPGLVADKGPQLTKCPRMQCSPLGAASRNPGADMRKVFQSYPASGAFSYGYDAFTQAMVEVGGKAPFLARELFQASPGGLGAGPLQLLAKAPVPVTDIFDGIPGENLTIGSGGDIAHPQVDAQKAIDIFGVRVFHVADRQQVKLAVAVNQVGFPLAVEQQSRLAFTADKGDLLASGERPDGHVFGIPAQNTVIVGDTAQGSEGAQSFPVQFVGIGDLGDAADYDLGGQIEVGLHLVVSKFVQVVLAELFLGPGCLTDGVARGIGPLDGVQQDGVLIGGRG